MCVIGAPSPEEGDAAGGGQRGPFLGSGIREAIRHGWNYCQNHQHFTTSPLPPQWQVG